MAVGGNWEGHIILLVPEFRGMETKRKLLDRVGGGEGILSIVRVVLP